MISRGYAARRGYLTPDARDVFGVLGKVPRRESAEQKARRP